MDKLTQNEHSTGLKNSLKLFQKQNCLYKFLFCLEWIIFIGFLFTIGYYAEEVWKGYRSNDVGIKVSKKKIEFMDHPTVTLW